MKLPRDGKEPSILFLETFPLPVGGPEGGSRAPQPDGHLRARTLLWDQPVFWRQDFPDPRGWVHVSSSLPLQPHTSPPNFSPRFRGQSCQQRGLGAVPRCPRSLVRGPKALPAPPPPHFSIGSLILRPPECLEQTTSFCPPPSAQHIVFTFSGTTHGITCPCK